MHQVREPQIYGKSKLFVNERSFAMLCLSINESQEHWHMNSSNHQENTQAHITCDTSVEDT